MIKPTVGRIVWVWIHNTQPQPLAAIIASVRSVDLINLSCFDAFGQPFDLQNVVLYYGEGDKPPYPYAEWIPKTEQLEEQVNKIMPDGTSQTQGNQNAA